MVVLVSPPAVPVIVIGNVPVGAEESTVKVLYLEQVGEQEAIDKALTPLGIVL